VIPLLGVLTLVALPWTGADLPGAIESTVKYRITVRDAPATHVALRASGIPAGWVGAWCTDRICSPTQTTVTIPASGVKSVEFQIVPDDPAHAGRHPLVRVEARAATVARVDVRG
jgi:hypothetical protein